MTLSEHDYQIQIAKLQYAVSPKDRLDWALYLARVQAIRARRPAEIAVKHGGILTRYLDVEEVMPCR